MAASPDLSTLLGEESPPIEFPSGLIGFEEYHRFVLVSHPEGDPLHLLQATDDPLISFIVADPQQIDPAYHLSLSDADREALQLDSADETSVYCILCIQEDPLLVTANLLGPLVINWRLARGRQVILSDSGYSTRHPVASAKAQAESDAC